MAACGWRCSPMSAPVCWWWAMVCGCCALLLAAQRRRFCERPFAGIVARPCRTNLYSSSCIPVRAAQIQTYALIQAVEGNKAKRRQEGFGCCERRLIAWAGWPSSADAPAQSLRFAQLQAVGSTGAPDRRRVSAGDVGQLAGGAVIQNGDVAGIESNMVFPGSTASSRSRPRAVNSLRVLYTVARDKPLV